MKMSGLVMAYKSENVLATLVYNTLKCFVLKHVSGYLVTDTTLLYDLHMLCMVFIFMQPISAVTRALVLTLGVCYQARLRERKKFVKYVSAKFQLPCDLPLGSERFEQEIDR